MNVSMPLVTLLCELLVSLALLGGAMFLLVNSNDQGVKQSMGVLVGAVVAFWFQRRSGDQATYTVATLANGKMSDMIQAQSTTNVKLAQLTGAVSGHPETGLIAGPQGPQGPQGPPGPTGPAGQPSA